MALPENTSTRLREIAEEVRDQIGSGDFQTSLDNDVQELIQRWPFGRYGYTAVTNLFLTASWYKWLDNNQDIRRCFVVDNTGAAVSSSYSGRGTDELHTVPLIAEFSLSQQFCSPNSGFQGSRKIENVKLPLILSNYNHLNVGWDKDTFFEIIAQIENSSSSRACETFRYLLSIAFTKQAELAAERMELLDIDLDHDELTAYRILTEEIQNIRDPQFHKLVVGAYYSLSTGEGVDVIGFEDSITGADARSGSAGDFSISVDGDIVEGVEAKDNTIQFTSTHINTARNRIMENETIMRYTMVTTGNQIISNAADINRIYALIDHIYRETGCLIRLTNIRVLLSESWGEFALSEYIQEISQPLGNENIPDIREGTLSSWMDLIQS
jgi:hypothetical protein